MALAKRVVGLAHAMLRRNKQDATQRCVYKWIKIFNIPLYFGRGLKKNRSPGRAELQNKKSRPVSRVLSWTVIPLGAASPRRSSNLPGSDAGRVIAPLCGLAPGGVCRAGLLPDSRCALTAPFHPCHACLATPFGGLLSVALSVGSRRPGVTWHRALWSPDFPRHPCG